MNKLHEQYDTVDDLARLGERLEKERSETIRRSKRWKFDTVAVHGLYSAEEAIEKNQGSVIEPLYLSTAQAFKNSDHMEASLAYSYPGWIYSRIANPTVAYLEDTLALLETYGTNTEAGAVATSSGMSAIFQALQPFLVRRNSGDNVNFVSSCCVYGGTFQQFSVRQHLESDVRIRWVNDPTDLDEWSRNIDSNTRCLYGEVPSNPGLMFFDIQSVADLAHDHGIPLIVDSTIATPALLRPLAHGADMVIHSLTKSMTSSGMAIGGAVIARKHIVTGVDNDQLKENAPKYLKLFPFRDFGPSISPFNALMTLNDLRVLRPRMKRLSENSQEIAEFLNDHRLVESVNYLGLKNNPRHELARRYMTLADSESDFGKPLHLYGHLLSFDIAGEPEYARNFLDHLQMIFRATDLGRIKSVATIPAISSHQQQGEEAREMAGISPRNVRLSVGGEHPDDIISDLDRALALSKKKVSETAARSPNGEVEKERIKTSKRGAEETAKPQ